MADRLRELVADHVALTREFFAQHGDAVRAAAEMVGAALRAGRSLLIFGNGGSAADAQHIAAELVGRYERDRRALAAIALTTDTSILTAVANDHGYERVFARQIEALGRDGDVAWGISTSGRSANVVAGLKTARERGLRTIAMTGRDGGLIGPLADLHLHVAHESTARVQEVHAVIAHAVCELIDRAIAAEARDGSRP